MHQVSRILGVSVLVLSTVLACSKKEKKLAPVASALASAKPTDAMSQRYVLDASKSAVTFTMDAELEKIAGRAPGSAEGELFVDLKNLEKSSGLIKVDLDKLSIYKRNRKDDSSEFGEEEKNEKQNRDMRTWFQINEDAPQAEHEKFRWAEFKITRVSSPIKDVSALGGAQRKVSVKVTGDFVLHGRKTEKTLDAELSFAFDGNKPKGLRIETQRPFDVGLEEHDVRPRKAFDQLADATLDALGAKVAKVAKVEVTAYATALPD